MMNIKIGLEKLINETFFMSNLFDDFHDAFALCLAWGLNYL